VTSKLKIPDFAVRMLRASSDIIAINKSNLPTELIPLNTIQKIIKG
jgi:indole-3-glycerol phosphate synthase